MQLRKRIGLVYLPGALPCFEDFGNLPTDLVREDALVDGKPASEVLDMLIIPGGSLVESQSVNPKVTKEILKMADAGKFLLGICSGFQILAKQTDIGRLSTIPITRDGLGLLDAEFKPLVCTDRVTAKIVDKSFVTDEIGKEVSGFHCHTYGQATLHNDAKPILISHIQRINYRKAPQDLVSGVTNKQGNIVGVFVHALLDQNPTILQSITKSLDINSLELEEIRKTNAKLIAQIKSEVGISTNIKQPLQNTKKKPVMVLITALGSGSGKTFLVTGMAGALKKKGYNVGLIKIGGDIRDSVPALYLVKEPIKDYSSIKIGESGWTPLNEAIGQASQKHDFLFVEGAMSAFTGLLNEKVQRPTSTAEVAVALGASTILVVSCDKEGIEGSLISTLNYISILKKLGVNTTGVILNKMSTSYLTDEAKLTIKKTFENVGVQLLGVVPRMELETRGMIPEIEIRYDDFGIQAIDAAERYINLDLLTKIAEAPKQKTVDYKEIMEKFKKTLANYSCNST